MTEDRFDTAAKTVLDALAEEHGQETFVTSAFSYYDDAANRFAALLRAEGARGDRLNGALGDIERILASMAQLGAMDKTAALKVFEDSFVVIAGICTAAKEEAP